MPQKEGITERLLHPNSHQGVISQVELSLILEGIEIKQARRFRRFHLRESIV
jgi:hypothetical protein